MLPVSVVAFDILVGTGQNGTFSQFAVKMVSRIIKKNVADIHCKPVPGADDIHNLTNLQGGSLDMTLVDSRMLHDAVNKKGNFAFLDINYDNLRMVTPLYDVPVTLVVRSDAAIASLDDLKGKRVNAGAPRSLQHRMMDTIMDAKKWTDGDFSLLGELPTSQSQDTMAFCHGTIQAMIHIGVHPDAPLRQLFKLCDAVAVSMDDSDIQKLIADDTAFYPAGIAAGIYPSQPDSVKTFGTRAMLAASTDLDEETVYGIVKAIFDNRALLKRAHPALSSISLEAARKNDTGIPLHPGAARFFSEQ
jgi:TRAP transporter TAXI family solute receptor